MDFKTEFLRTIIGGNLGRLFVMSDNGWEKEGRGAVMCMFGVDKKGKRVRDSETGRGSDEFDFTYVTVSKVREMCSSADKQCIIDATEKYNHKTEAIFIIMIEVEGHETPFIAQLGLQRRDP
jgi:hypothetical protein